MAFIAGAFQQRLHKHFLFRGVSPRIDAGTGIWDAARVSWAFQSFFAAIHCVSLITPESEGCHMDEKDAQAGYACTRSPVTEGREEVEEDERGESSALWNLQKRSALGAADVDGFGLRFQTATLLVYQPPFLPCLPCSSTPP